MTSDDIIYEQARHMVQTTKDASLSKLQRTFGISFNKAASYLDRMAKEGVVEVTPYGYKVN